MPEKYLFIKKGVFDKLDLTSLIKKSTEKFN